MKAILVMLAAIALARTSFADVQIITSPIQGSAVQSGSIINIVDPELLVGKALYSLAPFEETAKAACEMLGFKYHEMTSSKYYDREVRIAGIQDGILKFGHNYSTIKILHCKK